MSRPSPWNGILESLHSALIDALIEEFPDIKPELGMPIRRDAWSLEPDVTRMVVHELTCEQGQALAAIGINDAAHAALKKRPTSSPEKFLELLMRRAEPDFKRRGLSVTSRSADLTATSISPTRVIWIPLRISQKNDALVFHLGIGI